MPRDYYKILGISHSADLEEIKQGTQTKANDIKTALSFALLSHAEAQARLNEIEEAFETLSKPETRAAYDSQWQSAKSPRTCSPPILLQAKMDDVVIKQKVVIKKKMQPDYYDILEISHLADLEEIKQAVQTKVNEMKSVFGFTVLSYAEAQARLNEIEEAFETLSQPETRAAYDSQWQPTKSPRPRSPPIPLHAKMDDVVIKQKSASSLDRDESQVSPYLSPTVSLTDADRNTKKIELAELLTRLLAFRDDVLFPFVSVFLLFLLFLFVNNPEILAGHSSGHSYGEPDLVPVPFQIEKGLVFIGVIMLNLVLLYRYGQTFGKRQYSIKIVNADGSRARLGTLLVRTLVTYILLLAAIISMTKGFLPFPTSPPLGPPGLLIALLDPLFIVQKSRRCLHDMIANTIVVKVFPGQNDAPYGSLTDAIGISLLCVAPFLLILYY